MFSFKSVFKKSAVEMNKLSWAGGGTTIYAYINLIAASLYATRCLWNFVWLLILVMIEGVGSQDVYGCLALNVLAAVVFPFAALLFLGMYKSKPNYVLAYFIFGVFVDIVLMSLAAALHYIHTYVHTDKLMHDTLVQIQYPARNAFIGISFVYTLILVMIWCHIVFDDSRPDDRRTRKLSSNFNKSEYRID